MKTNDPRAGTLRSPGTAIASGHLYDMNYKFALRPDGNTTLRLPERPEKIQA